MAVSGSELRTWSQGEEERWKESGKNKTEKREWESMEAHFVFTTYLQLFISQFFYRNCNFKKIAKSRFSHARDKHTLGNDWQSLKLENVFSPKITEGSVQVSVNTSCKESEWHSKTPRSSQLTSHKPLRDTSSTQIMWLHSSQQNGCFHSLQKKVKQGANELEMP